MSVMRILLTNDDGVYAPGIAALHAALSAHHEVIVAAPETEQSAVGHAITLSDPIKVRLLGPRTGFAGYAVAGTPADCVKLALHELLDHKPDLVVSGINLGANLGVNLLYSGTVSAATEAAIQDLPAMAVSLGTLKDPDFTFAARFTAELVEKLPQLEIPPRVSLNVNVPAIAEEKIKGVRFTRQSDARLMERFIKRTDPRGSTYYWQAGETMGSRGDLDTDYPALLAGYITLTPVNHDLTHQKTLERLKKENPL